MLTVRPSILALVTAALVCVSATTASAAEATLVRDIKPLGSADPQWLTAAGKRAYFSAHDGKHGRELWVSDGTAAGTRMVKDIRPGTRGSQPDTLTRVGSRVYFTANDGRRGRELWVSDGTAAGTHVVKDLTKGPKGTMTLGIIGVGRTAYFDVVFDGLYRTDGSAGGTRRVHAFDAVSLRSAVAKGTRLFFPATVTASGPLASASPGSSMNLWKTNGTTTSTERLGPKELSVADLVKQAGRLVAAVGHGPRRTAFPLAQ